MKCFEPSTRLLRTLLLLAVVLIPTHVAWGANNRYIGINLGNWNVDANWDLVGAANPTHFVPDQFFNEAALVNNGNTVLLNSPAANTNSNGDVGGVKLGISGLDPAGDPENGGLRIESNGVLRAVVTPTVGGENGSIQVGGGTGTGTLTIVGNGMLTGTSLSLGGATASSISLSDTASLSLIGTPTGGAPTGTANLQRITTISGPTVNFNASGNLTLSSTSVLVADIRSATAHSALKTGGNASVSGTLKPMFTGITPAIGNTWNLVDAAGTITGNFATVDTSMAPALPAGQAFTVQSANVGGRNLLRLAIEEVLTLQVNRVTGAVSISNVGTQTKTIDGYSILSPHGSLNTTTWNSLDDQNVGGADRWVEAAPTANDLNELHPQAGGTPLNGSTSLALGTPYTKTFPAFGVDPDDVQFEYHTPEGRTIRGQVVYSGAKTFNNFVLNVDPTTGAVAFRNDSPFEIEIDGYAIYSASGSLVPGSFSSLDDQNVSGWDEAPPAPSATAVAELKVDGTTAFQGGTGFSLGNLFKTVGATQDLRFEFLQEGNDVPSIGTVVYGPFTAPTNPGVGLSGDYNNNGRVDAADYVAWRKNPTAHGGVPGGYNTWRTNFGRTSGSGAGVGSVAGVPEPGSALLLILAAVAALQLRGSRR
jgi:hypothetical protein